MHANGDPCSRCGGSGRIDNPDHTGGRPGFICGRCGGGGIEPIEITSNTSGSAVFDLPEETMNRKKRRALRSKKRGSCNHQLAGKRKKGL